MYDDGTKSDANAVLVLGRDIRAFLAVIRSLGRANVQVHVGMCPEDDLALKSKYVAEYHDIPEYSPTSDGWISAISALVEKHRFTLIVPTHDESAIPMQIYQEKLAPIVNIYSLAPSVFDIAFDKIKSSELAARLGVKLPRQASIELNELEAGLPEGFSLPIVIKPSSSYTKEDLGIRREVTMIKSPEQLQDVVEKYASWGEVLIQEVFEGIGTGVEVLADAGKILAIFQHMRVHEPIGGGASSYRKSIKINPELQKATEDLISALNYTGVAMVEFKFAPETKDWIFIEINGRFWGSLPLAIASGVDFPFYLYDLIVNENRSVRSLGKTEVYCRNLKRDLYWNIDNLKERRSASPLPDSIPMSTVAKELFRFLTLREHVDSFALDDPRPGLAEFREIISMVIAKGHSFAKRGVRNSVPVRKLRTKKIKDIVHSAQQILFVCSGNICRSPFAEFYARRHLPKVIAMRSCGFHERTNRTSPNQAIASAEHFDVDLMSHRSRVISDLLLEESDIVFIFEEKHFERLAEEHPKHIGKTFFLGDLKPSGDYEIEDPYGGDLERFTKIYKQVAYSLDTLRL